MIGGGYLAVAMSPTIYYSANGHISNATETNVRLPFPAGTVSDLRVYYQPAGHAQTITITVMKNGAATVLACTVAANATSCTDIDSFTTVAGDYLTVRGTASANVTPTALTFTMLFSAN